MEQIISLKRTFSWEGAEQTLCPALLRSGGDLILVDCGYPGFLPLLEDALHVEGFALSDLTHVVITHHDDDHMGALAELLQACPDLRVLASTAEVPYITGAERSLRLRQAEDLQPHLPPEMQAWGEAFQARLRQVVPCRVDEALEPGTTLPWCGGCEVIATPGHMPGHISLYLPQARTVITGDAAAVENGTLTVANPQFALDLPEAEASLTKLLALPAETYLCFHGGVFHKSM